MQFEVQRKNELDAFFAEKIVTFENANNHIYTFYDSYQKLEIIITFSKIMKRVEWLQLLGEHWQNCDNISIFLDDLNKLLPNHTCKEMMTSEEFASFSLLPDVCNIYRCCGEINKKGLSWTLDREIAEKFTNQNRYKQQKSILLVSQVKKSSIISLKLERQEYEVIVKNPSINEEIIINNI